MTPDGAFDRHLTTWLEEDAAPRAPQGFDEAVTESVNRKRQLPSWATPERWISLETRARLGAVPRTIVVLATIALLTLLMAGAIAIGANTTPRLPDPFGLAANGPIAYASDGDIWLVSADGETHTQLTSGPALDKSPAWALNGTRLAYASLVDDSYQLIVMDADGSDPAVVATDLETTPGFVRWKPDSTAVVLSRVDESLITDECVDEWSGVCGSRVWVAAADGSSFEQVGDESLDAYAPAWSPDGSAIVFSGRVSGEEQESFGLYLMDADGSDVRRLGDITGPPGRSLYWNMWSPDGSRIATQSIPNAIYVVDVESGAASVVYEGPAASFVVWSPDSSELAISDWGVGGVIVGEDGQERAVDALGVSYLHWSPDGTMLIGATEFLGDYTDPETEIEGPAIGFFDLDGSLLDTIQTPGRHGTGTIDFQRLAP